MHDPSRISQVPTQSDGPYSRRAVLFGAGAHASRARAARRPSRSRDSRRADAMVRFPLRRRVASPAPRAHAPRRARRCPPIAAAAVVALFLSATASARSKRRSMRTGSRSRHDLCSADDARAGRRVRASGTRLDARDAFRTLPLTRAFSLAPPISPFAIRDRRSSSLASSQLALPLIADRQLKPRPAVRRAGQDVHRGGVRRAVLRVRDRAR
jgi:hypothetical protein